VGPSGSGKTTLLDVLSGRANRGKLSASSKVLVNGKPRDKFFKRKSGYVMQDDALLGSLTVKETLKFASLLRLPNSMKMAEKEDRVNMVISELGLSKVSNQKVGSQFSRGISGGERRRVAIGIELLTSPSILFLDEPTSGLDGSSSFLVMEILSRLAHKSNRTIVFSIHQPRSSIFKLFDQLMLLCDGHVIYFGKASESLAYFDQLGYHCDPFTNPADFILDLLGNDEEKEKLIYGDKDEDLQQLDFSNRSTCRKHHKRYFLSSLYDDIEKLMYTMTSSNNDEQMNLNTEKQVEWQVSRGNKPNEDYLKSEYAAMFFTQFWVLLLRNFINLWRNPDVFWVRFIQSIFMALLAGSIFFQLSNNQSSIQKRESALFFICVYQALSSMPALSLFIEERGRFNRERISGSYSTMAYFLANTASQVPLLTIVSITFGCISYWLEERKKLHLFSF